MMVHLHGESGAYALFSDGSNAVVIDKTTNMIEEIGTISDLSGLQPWSLDGAESTEVHLELALGAINDLAVQTVTAAAGRMYTIPKGVQAEAKKALEWRKKHRRGGTPVPAAAPAPPP